MRYLPTKDLVNITKQKSRYGKAALINAHFDLVNSTVCNTFSNSDFDYLLMNQNLDRRNLFLCLVNRGMVDKVRILLQDKRVDPSAGGNKAIISASTNGYINVVKELLKDKRVDPFANHNSARRWDTRKAHT